MDNEVNLRINDKEMRMNAFVQKAFAGVITGLVSSLNDLPEGIKKIEIAVKVKAKEGGE